MLWYVLLLSCYGFDLYFIVILIYFAPPTLCYDNLSDQCLAIQYVRTKHIELDQHFIRDKILHYQLTLKHVSSSNQVTHILTKPLASSQFPLLKVKLMVLLRPLVWYRLLTIHIVISVREFVTNLLVNKVMIGCLL